MPRRCGRRVATWMYVTKFNTMPSGLQVTDYQHKSITRPSTPSREDSARSLALRCKDGSREPRSPGNLSSGTGEFLLAFSATRQFPKLKSYCRRGRWNTRAVAETYVFRNLAGINFDVRLHRVNHRWTACQGPRDPGTWPHLKGTELVRNCRTRLLDYSPAHYHRGIVFADESSKGSLSHCEWPTEYPE